MSSSKSPDLPLWAPPDLPACAPPDLPARVPPRVSSREPGDAPRVPAGCQCRLGGVDLGKLASSVGGQLGAKPASRALQATGLPREHEGLMTAASPSSRHLVKYSNRAFHILHPVRGNVAHHGTGAAR